MAACVLVGWRRFVLAKGGIGRLPMQMRAEPYTVLTLWCTNTVTPVCVVDRHGVQFATCRSAGVACSYSSVVRPGRQDLVALSGLVHHTR